MKKSASSMLRFSAGLLFLSLFFKIGFSLAADLPSRPPLDDPGGVVTVSCQEKYRADLENARLQYENCMMLADAIQNDLARAQAIFACENQQQAANLAADVNLWICANDRPLELCQMSCIITPVVNGIFTASPTYYDVCGQCNQSCSFMGKPGYIDCTALSDVFEAPL